MQIVMFTYCVNNAVYQLSLTLDADAVDVVGFTASRESRAAGLRRKRMMISSHHFFVIVKCALNAANCHIHTPSADAACAAAFMSSATAALDLIASLPDVPLQSPCSKRR